MRLLVVSVMPSPKMLVTNIRWNLRITNVRHCDEDFERILFIGFSDTALNITLDFGFAFLSMTIDISLTPI